MRFEEIEPGIRYTFRTNVREYNEPVVHHKLSMAYRFLTIIEGSFRLLTSGIEEECERGDLILRSFIPGIRSFSISFLIIRGTGAVGSGMSRYLTFSL